MIRTANLIYSVFQLSYSVEAKLLESDNLTPLQRPIENIKRVTPFFFGYFIIAKLAGIVEIDLKNKSTEINSLVVHPKFFRRGIAKSLMEFVFSTFVSVPFIIETGIANAPATELYRKLGFTEVKRLV